MKLEISDKYRNLESWIRDAAISGKLEGDILRDQRNLIVRCDACGYDLVIKRFRKPIFINRIAYTFFRKSKAERAYRNAKNLLKLGYLTPEPIAYTVTKKLGLVYSGIFVCPYCPDPTVESKINDLAESEQKELLDALAKYTARMHDDGIFFYDYNVGNILYRCDSGGNYIFTLIDCNRIKFYGKRISFHKCVEVLYRLILDPQQYIYFMCRYASYRGVNWKVVSSAVLLKQELNLGTGRRLKHWLKDNIMHRRRI